MFSYFILCFAIFLILSNFVKNQQTIGMSLNTCGTNTVGDKMPTDSSECTNDKTVNAGGLTCCYISSNTPLGSATFCYAFPVGSTSSAADKISKDYGVVSDFVCSSNFIYLKNILIFILVLVLIYFD